MTPEQLDLFPLGAPEIQAPPSGLTIQQAFEQYHALNPWVYEALVKLARDSVARGRTRVGMKHLVEKLRWEWNRATVDPASEFKLNNNATSRYSRLIEAQEPDLAGVFELRVLRAA